MLMRYYHDWEFYEDGKTIQPISVGVVGEDGRELYIEFNFDWSQVPAGHFLWENVYPHLEFDDVPDRKGIQNQLRRFITKDGTEFDNELWGYYSSYDHVCLAHTFGRMVDMPDGVPWFTQDIKQEQVRIEKLWFKHGLLLPEQKDTKHHALADARWTKDAHEYLILVERDFYGKEIVDGWS